MSTLKTIYALFIVAVIFRAGIGYGEASSYSNMDLCPPMQQMADDHLNKQEQNLEDAKKDLQQAQQDKKDPGEIEKLQKKKNDSEKERNNAKSAKDSVDSLCSTRDSANKGDPKAEEGKGEGGSPMMMPPPPPKDDNKDKKDDNQNKQSDKDPTQQLQANKDALQTKNDDTSKEQNLADLMKSLADPKKDPDLGNPSSAESTALAQAEAQTKKTQELLEKGTRLMASMKGLDTSGDTAKGASRSDVITDSNLSGARAAGNLAMEGSGQLSPSTGNPLGAVLNDRADISPSAAVNAASNSGSGRSNTMHGFRGAAPQQVYGGSEGGAGDSLSSGASHFNQSSLFGTGSAGLQAVAVGSLIDSSGSTSLASARGFKSTATSRSTKLFHIFLPAPNTPVLY